MFVPSWPVNGTSEKDKPLFDHEEYLIHHFESEESGESKNEHPKKFCNTFAGGEKLKYGGSFETESGFAGYADRCATVNKEIGRNNRRKGYAVHGNVIFPGKFKCTGLGNGAGLVLDSAESYGVKHKSDELESSGYGADRSVTKHLQNELSDIRACWKTSPQDHVERCSSCGCAEGFISGFEKMPIFLGRRGSLSGICLHRRGYVKLHSDANSILPDVNEELGNQGRGIAFPALMEELEKRTEELRTEEKRILACFNDARMKLKNLADELLKVAIKELQIRTEEKEAHLLELKRSVEERIRAVTPMQRLSVEACHCKREKAQKDVMRDKPKSPVLANRLGSANREISQRRACPKTRAVNKPFKDLHIGQSELPKLGILRQVSKPTECIHRCCNLDGFTQRHVGQESCRFGLLNHQSSSGKRKLSHDDAVPSYPSRNSLIEGCRRPPSPLKNGINSCCATIDINLCLPPCRPVNASNLKAKSGCEGQQESIQFFRKTDANVICVSKSQDTSQRGHSVMKRNLRGDAAGKTDFVDEFDLSPLESITVHDKCQVYERNSDAQPPIRSARSDTESHAATAQRMPCSNEFEFTRGFGGAKQDIKQDLNAGDDIFILTPLCKTQHNASERNDSFECPFSGSSIRVSDSQNGQFIDIASKRKDPPPPEELEARIIASLNRLQRHGMHDKIFKITENVLSSRQ